jgi:hypothetical protein
VNEKTILKNLDDIAVAIVERFGESNPERVQQALSHLTTAKMAIEHVHAETPFRIGA